MREIPRAADVVVVGGGVHGASVAYHLAKMRAGRVVLVERKFLASGPTGRSSALVRRFYAMDFLTRTANASADVFQRWGEAIGGDPGYRQVGVLWLAAADREAYLRDNVRRARELGANVVPLTATEVRALVPEMAVDDVALGVHEPASGYADAAATTNALATRARELGATVLLDLPVEAVRVAGGKVAGVRLAGGGEIDAPRVVVCAGLWANRLLAPLGIEVPVAPKRHQMCFFRRPPGFASHPAVLDRPQATYMRPETGNLTIHGLIAYDEVVDPDHYNEGADAGEVLKNAERIANRFPVMEHGLSMGGYSGVYDVTPDHEPVLGPIPEYAGLHADFGWSGHGFKHAPAVGAVVAEAVLEGSARGWDLAPFRWSRFRDGALLPPASGTDAPHPRDA